MVSLVCVYNKLDVYQNMVNSLVGQTAEYELVGVDNTRQEFKSAACALNHGASQAHGDTMIFLHQDILFHETNALHRIIQMLQSLDESNVILGLYGAGGEVVYGAIPTTALTRAETLDECLVVMHRSTWQQYKFNEQVCDGWHLYAVELCLRASRDGCYIYQMNGLPIEHLSTGEINGQYMEIYRRLMKAFPDKKRIKTTCVSLPNNRLVFALYYSLWRIKKKMLGNYPLRSTLREMAHRFKK